MISPRDLGRVVGGGAPGRVGILEAGDGKDDQRRRRRMEGNACGGQRRVRHGGARKRIDLDEACSLVHPSSDDLLALDEALSRLASLNPVRAEVVKLRFFAGLTMAEVAQTLGISLPTANRYWAFARTWLYTELKGEEPPAGG